MNRLPFLLFFTCSFYFGFSQTPDLEIWQIQGDSHSSPYEDSEVNTNSNIVTAVGSDRFFIQTPSNRSDNNTMTSDGMMVYTGSDPTVLVGDLVNITGMIKEYQGLTEFSNSGLEIEVINSNQSLPEETWLNNDFPQGIAQDLPELERVEGMLVRFENGMVTGPSSSYGTAYVNAGGTRTFREAGISYPGISGYPVWDENPELFIMDVKRFLNETPDLFSGTVVSSEGVMSYADHNYVLYSTNYFAEENILGQGVRQKIIGEYTLGSINTYIFTEGGSSYQARLAKMAKYIVEGMKSPDIVAMQEVANITVLSDLVDKITELYPLHFSYTPHLLGAGGGSFSIQLGFLVSYKLTDVQVTELGEDELLTIGGTLHDRPPLLLEAMIPGSPPTPINVLNIHSRSLNGIEGSNSDFVRTKRHEQAVSVANMINEREDQNLIIVGDFNAYQFSDGYVDVFNQISGLPSLGALSGVEIVNDPPLLHYNNTLPESQQYSYVYRGNAQMIDHCLSTPLTNIHVNEMLFLRGNSDRPDDFYDNTSPYGVSDHDGFVLYFQTGDVVSTTTLSNDTEELVFPNPFHMDSSLKFIQEKGDQISLRLFSLDGRLCFEKNLGFYEKGEHTIQPGFPALNGLYIVNISNSSFDARAKILLVN